MATTGIRNTEAKTQEMTTLAGKYLVFGLSGEECCIPVLKVREIMGVQDITAVPQTPNYVRGVINLRGKVIPVIDLRLRFCLPPEEYTERTCIIVVSVSTNDHSALVGAVVDSVAEVVNITPADVEDTPNFGDGVATTFLLGMAKIRGKVTLLLDIEQILTRNQLCELERLMDPA